MICLTFVSVSLHISSGISLILFPDQSSASVVVSDSGANSLAVASTGVMSFENTMPDNAKVIMGAGNVPSMLGGINLFMFGGYPLKGLAKEAGKVSDDLGETTDLIHH